MKAPAWADPARREDGTWLAPPNPHARRDELDLARISLPSEVLNSFRFWPRSAADLFYATVEALLPDPEAIDSVRMLGGTVGVLHMLAPIALEAVREVKRSFPGLAIALPPDPDPLKGR